MAPVEVLSKLVGPGGGGGGGDDNNTKNTIDISMGRYCFSMYQVRPVISYH